MNFHLSCVERRRLAWMAAITCLGLFSTVSVAAEDWQRELERQLPLLGHRNWIVIADSAYPSQTAAGIKTIYAGGDQVDAVRHVLNAVDRADHVRASVFLDTELQHVSEQAASGIDVYRTNLKSALSQHTVTTLPHEVLIDQLQKAGEDFHVVVIKTDLTLPYTSVFIRLDAGYWSDEAERALRRSMQSATGGQHQE